MPYIIKELQKAGITNNKITLLVATGIHREVTREEMVKMFGDEVVKSFRIINHSTTDSENMVDLGETRHGIPVIIDKLFAQANIKILTGLIGLHHTAGFGGGPKSIIPGIAGYQVIKIHHSFPFRSRQAALGELEKNLFHEAVMEAARMVKDERIGRKLLH